MTALKLNLKKLALIFAVSIITISCCTTENIVYRDKEIIIPGMIENANLDDSYSITINEYKMIIQEFRWKILYYEIKKNAGHITSDQYNSFKDKYNAIIEEINKKIKQLELLE